MGRILFHGRAWAACTAALLAAALCTPAAEGQARVPEVVEPRTATGVFQAAPGAAIDREATTSASEEELARERDVPLVARLRRVGMHRSKPERHPFLDLRSIVTGPLWEGASDRSGTRSGARKPRRRAPAPEERDQYALLMDAEHMLDVFRRELPAWAETPIRVTRCSVEPGKTVKSRRAIRGGGQILVVYTLGVEERGVERELVLIGVAPVGPQSVDLVLDKRCASPRDPPLASFERLAIHLRDLKTAVFAARLDPTLPALAEVTGSQGAALLAPHLREVGRGARIERIESELKHYKPLRRAVVRVTATFAGPDPVPAARSLYVKIFRDDRGAISHRDLAALWAAAQGSSSLRIPEPLGYDPRCRMLLMSEAAGAQTIGHWIRRLECGEALPATDLERLERCMVVTAHALRDLQVSGLRLDERRPFQGEFERLKDDRELLRAEVGEGTELARRIDRVLDRLALLAPIDEALAPAHGAFRHKQFVGDERTLTVIDWDGLCMASPALDAATFLVRLCQQEWGAPGSAPELEGLAARFRVELRAVLPAAGAHLAPYEVLVLMDSVLRSFRSMDGVAGGVVPNLVATAERILDRALATG